MSNPLNAFPFGIRLENAVLSYAQYLKKAFWPSRLSILYPHPGYSLKTGTYSWRSFLDGHHCARCQRSVVTAIF